MTIDDLADDPSGYPHELIGQTITVSVTLGEALESLDIHDMEHSMVLSSPSVFHAAVLCRALDDRASDEGGQHDDWYLVELGSNCMAYAAVHLGADGLVLGGPESHEAPPSGGLWVDQEALEGVESAGATLTVVSWWRDPGVRDDPSA